MTVIVWDGKTLAADRLGSFGGTRRRVRKVYRMTIDGKPWLIAGAGSAAAVAAWVEWLRGRADRPSITATDGFLGIMVDSRRRLWYVEWTLVPYRVFAKTAAIGAGRGEAMGAMAMGADARRAVLIAQSLDTSCGLGVDCVTFD